jgi:putative copper export protein
MLIKVALFLHVISAIFWVGGMLFITLVVAPFLMTMPDPADRSKVYQFVGKKYRKLGWIAIITLLVTGPILLYTIYGISMSDIFLTSLHSTPIGKALSIKLTFVVIIVLSSLVHDFWLGPKARNSKKFSLIAKIFGRSNLVIALLIVIFAVILRAGGL